MATPARCGASLQMQRPGSRLKTGSRSLLRGRLSVKGGGPRLVSSSRPSSMCIRGALPSFCARRSWSRAPPQGWPRWTAMREGEARIRLRLSLPWRPHAGNPQKYLSQFIDNGGLSREDLVERVAAAVRAGRGLTAAFRSALSRFSGNRDLDPQGDGYYQERWVFDGGSLVSWVRDTHKDGLPEYTAGFKGGMPVSLTVRTGADTILTLSYNTYPFVDSAKLSTPGGETARTFLLVPYEMKFPFLASQTLPVPAGLAPLATRTAGKPIRRPDPQILLYRRRSRSGGRSHAEDRSPAGQTSLHGRKDPGRDRRF